MNYFTLYRKLLSSFASNILSTYKTNITPTNLLVYNYFHNSLFKPKGKDDIISICEMFVLIYK